MNISKFKEIILKESLKYIFEEEDIYSTEELENLLDSSDKELKRTKNLIDAENAYLSKIQDLDLKKSSNIKIQDLKQNLTNAQKNNDMIKKAIEVKKNAQKSMEMKQKQEKSVLNKMEPQTEVNEAEGQVVNKVVKNAPPIQKQVSPVKTQPPVVNAAPSNKKTYVVKFDQNTESPYEVSFSQRGFLIGDTRLSFELIEKALSKGFTITLKNGFVLNPVRMQKIIKYKDRF